MEQREELRHRLRRLGMVRGVRELPPSPRRAVAIESLVKGNFYETPHGRCFVAHLEFPLHHLHGTLPLDAFFSIPPRTLAAMGGDPLLAEVESDRVLFLDTETTGLSGGTGTMAFLVGMGFFEGDRFHILQPFLRDPGDELPMVYFLQEQLSRFQALITFNGHGFDLPILETRFLLARLPFPLAGVPHLDLLSLSRRLWRERLPSCALGVLEREVLGVRRDQADVPSGVIPLIYRDYLRTGDAREIVRVLYHNQVDILSMVTLVARLARIFTDPLREPDVTGAELYCLARWYEEAGGDVEGMLRTALAAGLPLPLRLRALRDLAQCIKRSGRYAETTVWWQQLAVEDPQGILAPVELAKLFEWYFRRPFLAAGWTRLALARARQWPEGERRDRVLCELLRRLERLERQMRRLKA